MKWKIFCISILLPCFVLSANAHPGRTDSKGGHTNHSTGEYHYHHGRSEHQHYDIDGDGILDCPYTFKPSTKTEVKPSTKTETQTNTNTQSTTSKTYAKKEEENEFAAHLGAAVGCGAVLFLIFRPKD